MDRTYVTQQHKTPVFQLGLDLWRDHVVHNATIQQVRARRGGGGAGGVSACVCVYVCLFACVVWIMYV